MSSNKRTVRNTLMGGTAAIAAALLFVGAGSTGADFSASDTGNVSINSGTLTVELSDSQNTGTFELSYPNLAPGEMKADKFTVKNTGSLPANVKISGVNVGANNLSGLTPAQLGMLKASIDGYKTATPVTAMTGEIPLGSLAAGQSRTYTVRVGLDQAAGNEWQNRNVAAGVTVTLNQQ